MGISFCIPVTNLWVLLLLYILSNIWYCQFFVLLLAFIISMYLTDFCWIFNDVELLFLWFFVIYLTFLVKCLSKSLDCFFFFFNWLVCLIIEFWEFFLNSGYKSLFSYVIYKNFLPVSSLPFHSLEFCRVFNLIKFNLSSLYFMNYTLGVIFQTLGLTQDHQRFCPVFYRERSFIVYA